MDAQRKLLLQTELRNVFSQKLFVLLFRIVHGLHDRRPFFEVDLVPLPRANVL
jgi:hypothetical protein